MSEPTIEIIDVDATAPVQVLEVSEGLVTVLVPGPQGETGPQGVPGEAGPQGETGPAGAKGDKGETGARGADGAAGPKGDSGATGPQGDTGPQGAMGAKGETGAAGARGETGAVGATGPQGDKGEPGNDGATGPQGVPGADGAKGDTGATGPQGAVGATGAKGDKGDTGPQGAAGEKGETGLTGATGPKGDQGLPGAVGQQGEKGDTGAQGPQGEQGPIGPAGPQGETGAAGPKGDTGATGPAGSAGSLTLTGQSGSIQYKDSKGKLVGASGVLIQPDRNAIAMDGSIMVPYREAQHPFVVLTGTYGQEGNRIMGQHAAFTSTREWMPTGGTATYNRAMTVATTGTATAQTMRTSRWLAEPTLNYVSAAAAGSQATWLNSNPVVVSTDDRAGGFLITIRLSVKNWATGKRWFVGLQSDTTTPGNVDPTSLNGFFGIGVNAGDTTVSHMGRSASGSLLKDSTPIAADLNGENVTFVFKCNPGENTIYSGFQLGGYGWGDNLNSGFNGLLYPVAWVSNGAVASSITLSMNRAYVEYLTNF